MVLILADLGGQSKLTGVCAGVPYQPQGVDLELLSQPFYRYDSQKEVK
jgi:hypothetical protein